MEQHLVSHNNNYYYNLVKNFMITCDQSVDTPLLINNMEVNKFRQSLINEEGNLELYEAIINKDIIDIIDSLGDTLYVIFGTGITYGIPLVSLYSNYNTKKLSIYKTSTMDLSVHKKMLDLINLIDYSNLDKLKLTLQNVIDYIYVISEQFNLNINYAFILIHNSNMTKFCKTIDEAEKTIKYYKENKNSPYKNPLYKKYNDLYIVFEGSTGKILKSIYYDEVNIKSMFK